MTTSDRARALDDGLWRARIAHHIAKHGGSTERQAALERLEHHRDQLDQLVAGDVEPRRAP